MNHVPHGYEASGRHLEAVRFVNLAPSERDRLPHPDAGFGHREAVARRGLRDDRLHPPCGRVGVKDQTIVRPVTTADVCCQS